MAEACLVNLAHRRRSGIAAGCRLGAGRWNRSGSVTRNWEVTPKDPRIGYFPNWQDSTRTARCAFTDCLNAREVTHLRSRLALCLDVKPSMIQGSEGIGSQSRN